jgi:glutathione peroxidase
MTIASMRTGLAGLLLSVIVLVMGSHACRAGSAATTAFDHEFEAIEGGALPLAQWRGKVLLVVNTASFCAFTPQYQGLQTLWERYQTLGLVVIGVPSNDFGAQEPNSDSDILGFCKGAFNVTFPLTAKQVVAGKAAHPFYRWARETLGDTTTPQWNFHKYLVGRDGRLLAAYGSQIEPLSPELASAIETALAAH